MCDPTPIRVALSGIPFKIAALANSLAPGSYERSLANSVCESVRRDIEYAISQLPKEEK